eukprot:6211808-Pleurochrysis_carterae.AAC.2
MGVFRIDSQSHTANFCREDVNDRSIGSSLMVQCSQMEGGNVVTSNSSLFSKSNCVVNVQVTTKFGICEAKVENRQQTGCVRDDDEAVRQRNHVAESIIKQILKTRGQRHVHMSDRRETRKAFGWNTRKVLAQNHNTRGTRLPDLSKVRDGCAVGRSVGVVESAIKVGDFTRPRMHVQPWRMWPRPASDPGLEGRVGKGCIGGGRDGE